MLRYHNHAGYINLPKSTLVCPSPASRMLVRYNLSFSSKALPGSYKYADSCAKTSKKSPTDNCVTYHSIAGETLQLEGSYLEVHGTYDWLIALLTSQPK